MQILDVFDLQATDWGSLGYGYGYAHPGEVSIVKRLLPWRGGRKAGAASSAAKRSTVGMPAPPTASEHLPARAAASDPDDPWV